MGIHSHPRPEAVGVCPRCRSLDLRCVIDLPAQSRTYQCQGCGWQTVVRYVKRGA